MGKIWIRELTGGLDTRRLPETASGAILLRGNNGHITRGGEFEKRQAFIRKYQLPAGKTAGLVADASGLYVFGRTTTPAGMPSGVAYQQLVHPTNSALDVAKIIAFDLNSGKIYVIAEFSDASRHLYYDGAYVTSWADGFARGWFELDPTGPTGGEGAVGTFKVTAGTNTPADKVTSIKADGNELIGAPVQHTGDNTTTAAAIASAIRAYSGTSGYTAKNTGNKVAVEAPDGTSYNNDVFVAAVGGAMVIGALVAFTGGVNPKYPKVTNIQCFGVDIMTSVIKWETTVQQMATDIAAAINTLTATTGFSATTTGRRVTLAVNFHDEAIEGQDFRFTGKNGFGFKEQKAMSGNTVKSLPKGTFLKTIASKVYAVSDDVFHFSGVAAPTAWTTDNVGAGFIDMASQISGMDNLTAVAKYQEFAAVFAETSTVIEYIDPDPNLNRLVQTLENTGTASPKSVTQFGDTDLFYLDRSGLRSLKARTGTNSAATTDIGVAVDDSVTAKFEALTATERANVIGCIEPREGRFWLIMKDVVYVFSYYQGAKVSAWTTYDLTSFINGVETAFSADYETIYDKRVYIRSGDDIYVYGGIGTEKLYDACEAEAWTPYLDAGDPARAKDWCGIDVACRGVWRVDAAMDLNQQSVSDHVANVFRTTYPDHRIAFQNSSTHISLRFSTTEASAAKLASACVHYQGNEIED